MWYNYSINDRFVKIGEAAKILGVHTQILEATDTRGSR